VHPTRTDYIYSVGFAWSEAKRKSNLEMHGFDFVDTPRVFEGPTYTYQDDRFHYSEQRFVTLGLLEGLTVSIVHTETRTVLAGPAAPSFVALATLFH
jgi:uncharacterized DUF497 family protein